jgi:tRNA (guanine-N(7)-)-methyltransferase subunit TRM82
MSKTRTPYQCLQKCGSILIGARGSSIDSFSLHDGSLLSTWKCPPTHGSINGTGKATAKTTKQNSEASSVDTVLEKSSHPTKRRKLSAGDDEAKINAKEGEKKVNNRLDAVASGLRAPAVTALAATKDGRHVIAVTGEDKSIRVFENAFERNGAPKQQLRQLSQR